jgi:hypothetical protein
MKRMKRVLAITLAACTLAACADTQDDMSVPDATDAASQMMIDPCLEQTARLTGKPLGDIYNEDPIETGGGPVIPISVGDADYSCRLNADGTVTVSSETAS